MAMSLRRSCPMKLDGRPDRSADGRRDTRSIKGQRSWCNDITRDIYTLNRKNAAEEEEALTERLDGGLKQSES
jgi:hypothetical protein